MLEHEQHVLPVDLLFDDEQIGDFVKSIQIDSPYQQMLLEGVLTESVRDEKLYVSFAVEGYFHYVLGEVIYTRNEGLGAEALKQIAEGNKLNGAKEGVEQCLIRDVQKDDLDRLIWMIDNYKKSSVVCSMPLAMVFLQVTGNFKTEQEIQLARQIHIKSAINKILLEPTDNCINTLEKAISYLKKKQKNDIVSILYKQINFSIKPNNFKRATIYLSSLRYVSNSDLPNKIKLLETFNFEINKSAIYALYIGRLGGVYLKQNIADYKKAISFFNKALELNLNRYPESYISVSVNYNELGLAYMLQGDFDNSIENHKKSLTIQLENNHDDVSSTLECLGVVELKRKNFKAALDWFENALKIKEYKLGYYHSNVASTISAIALIYTNIGDSENAIKNWQKTLQIEINLNKHEKQSIAVINKKLGEEYYKSKNYNLAITHLLAYRDYLKSINKIDVIITDITNKLLKCYNAIGLEKYKSCNYSESVNTYISALKLIDESKIILSEIPHFIYFNLGNAYFKDGQLDQAKIYLNQALKIRIQSIEKNPILVGRTYNSMGNVELSKGNVKKARALYQKAYYLFLHEFGIEHEHTKQLSKKIRELNDL
jgi:tetratricopeptide (TPR) repeat protein